MTDEVLIPCGICEKEFDHTEVCGGFSSMDKEELEDLGLTNMFKKFPQLLEDWACVCNDCLDNEDNHKGESK